MADKADRKGLHAQREPKQAATKTAKKIADAVVVKPLGTIAKAVPHLIKGALAPLPWAASKTLSHGAKAGRATARAAKGLGRTAVQEEKGGLDALADRIGRGDKSATQEAVEALRRGIVDTLVLAQFMASKMLLMAAVVHSTPLSHMAIGHLLAGNFEDELLDAVHMGATGTQVGVGAGLLHATHASFGSTLEKSNLWAYDRERGNIAAEKNKVRRSLQTLQEALGAVRALDHSAEGQKIRTAKLQSIVKGLQAAEKMELRVDGEAFADFAKHVDTSAVQKGVDQLLKRAGYGERGGEVSLRHLGAQAATSETSTLMEDLAKLSSWSHKGLLAPLSRMRDASKLAMRLQAARKAMGKADKEVESLAMKLQQRLDVQAEVEAGKRTVPGGDSEAFLAKTAKMMAQLNVAAARAQVSYLLFQDATVAEQAHARGVTGFHTDTNPNGRADDLRRAGAVLQQALDALALNESVYDHPSNVGSQGAYKLLRDGYEARARRAQRQASAYEAQLAELIGALAQVDVGAKPRLQARIAKVENKRDIARLKAEMAALDRDLGDGLRAPGSEMFAEAHVANRARYLVASAELDQLKQAYVANLAAQKRTSAFVQPNADPLQGAPSLVQGTVKAAWYTAAAVPVVNLPYWGIRGLNSWQADVRYRKALRKASQDEVRANKLRRQSRGAATRA